MNTISIYTDGSCTNNGKKDSYGAYSFVIISNGILIYEYSEFKTGVTNNQMEILGVSKSLEYLLENHLNSQNVYIHSDSEYVVKGITEWIKGWKKNNWKNAAKQPVKNKEYWMDLDSQCKNFNNLYFKWVKGHQNNIEIDTEWNNYVDQLCTAEVERNGGVSFETQNQWYKTKVYKI